jgi:hypothetical protein
MNKITEAFFDAPNGVFTISEAEAVLGGTAFSRHGLIKRAMAEGEILQIRRGLYCLAPRYLRHPINSFVLGQHIYGPSYISFESALAFHGWIPEAVYSCTSASFGNARSFDTPLGVFSFQRVPQGAFLQEVERQVDAWGGVYLLATAPKALCDLVYARRLKWRSAAEAASHLRIEPENLLGTGAEELNILLGNYSSRRVQTFIRGWREELGG